MTAVAVYATILLVVLVTSQAAVIRRQAGFGPVTKQNCPSDWDPAPCNCQDIPHSDKASVYCDNATSGEEIKSIFDKLKGNVTFATFSIKDAPLASLPAGAFGKASFQMFFITNTNLSSVADDAFKGSEKTAESFLLHNNNFEKFNFKSLQTLLKLKNFELSGDQLRAIPDDAFGKKDNLEVVIFNDNKISSLGKNIFNQLPKLRTIDLGRNNLTELGDSALSTDATENPISVLLSHNEISKIDKNAFKDLNVRLMELEDNKLEKLDQDTFKPILESILKNHGTLSTMGNQFGCDRGVVGWIVDLPPEQKSHVIGYTCRDGKAMEELQSGTLQ